MITLSNLYKLRQLSSSYKGNLGVLLDLFSAGRIHNLNFFDLLSRNPQKAFHEYQHTYREDFITFSDTVLDVIENQYPECAYLQEMIAHIHDFYMRLDLELSGSNALICEYAYLEKEYFSPLDTLFWGLEEILHTLSDAESDDDKQEESESVSFSDEHIAEVQKCLFDGLLEMYGQKIYRNTQEIVDIELLARLKTSANVILMPDNFLPIIEHLGLVADFDWQVLEKSFKLIGKNEKGITFSINVNPITFQQEGFVDKLRLLAKTYGIKEKYIVLEVLEYGEIEDMEMIDAIFSELRQIGFKIAIDDYPSGYNTLAFVTRFKNIDIIKIDGMHVVDMYRTCHSCQSIDTCIQPFLRDVRVTDKWHCIRRLNEKYDLESLMQSFRFLKILYPNLVFFAERIEDDGVYSFFSKIPALISGYQGYFFQRPERFDRVCSYITEKSCLLVPAESTSRVMPSISMTRSGKRISQENNISERVFFEHIIGLEKFCYSIVELNMHVEKNDIGYSEKISRDFLSLIQDIMRFLNVTALNFYYVQGETVLIKSITIGGKVELFSMPLHSGESVSMIEKQYVNFFTLYHGQKDFSHGGYDISHIPVQNLGDDIVVKITPEFYIGVDDMESARSFDKQIQVSLVILLAAELGRIYQKNR